MMTTDIGKQSDKLLLIDFQRSKNPEAFAVLVERYHGMIYGVAKRMLGCTHAAEDVVQATFLVLAKDATKIRNRTSLASWLYGIAFRISARAVQKRSRITATPLESEVMVDADPLEKLSEQFEHNTVFEELHALPEKNRTPMVLRYLQGKSNVEVAEELSLSESAVEGRLKRGRNQLRLRLARQGVAFSVGVTLLGAIKQDASAADMTQLVANTVEACTADSSGAGGDITNSEAIRLAEQEMMKMFTAKMMTGVWAAAASLCVVATGWGLAGNATVLAQGSNPFGDGGDSATAEDPFGVSEITAADDDPFAANAVASTNPFASSPYKTATATQNAATLIERMQKLGQYGFGNETEAEVRIMEALASKNKASFEFNEEPLEQVAAFISDQHDIQIVFDTRALEDEGIDPSSDPITADLRNVRLQSAMNIILDSVNLAAVVRDEILMITSKSAAEGMLSTRLYKLPEHWPITEEKLVDTITSLTEPHTWDSVGGPGTLKPVTGGLFISNTHSVHTEVNKLFAQLDKLYATTESN